MSKRYKLDLALIERTKLLEGNLCQTLTFTNENKRVYSIIGKPANAVSIKIETPPNSVALGITENAIRNAVESNLLQAA